MFEKIEKTDFPPSKEKPVMLWDGECGFCRYWTVRWEKMTGSKVEYHPYQEVASEIKDIDVIHFKRASRLIEPSGLVFSGPRSAYRTFTYGNSSWAFLDKWYASKKWFSSLSDWGYDKVANNRNFFFKLTKAFFGSNPNEVRPFWVIYLFVLLYLIYSI